MKKNHFLLCAVLLAAVTLAGCGVKDEDTAKPAKTTGESEDSADPEEPLEAADEKSGSITSLAIDVPTKLNGKEFTVTTEQAYPDDEEILAVNAVYGDETLKLDECLGVTGVYEVQQEDGIYVMADTYSYNDYHIVYLVKIDENGITQTDTRDGALGALPSDPRDGFPITSKIDVLGTYGGTRTYAIENGRFTTESSLYEFLGTPDGYRPTLTMKSSIPCRIEGGNTELKPGDVIIPTGYSEEGVFCFEKQDGTPGSFPVDLDEEGYYTGTVGGIDENELFESLPYAG